MILGEIWTHKNEENVKPCGQWVACLMSKRVKILITKVKKKVFFFLKKNGQTPASFLFSFGLVQTNIITIFTTD